METIATRARDRIRAEMHRIELNQTDLANQIGWTQSKISKVLNGDTDLGVDDLEALCFGVALSMTEVVRDQGLEFCAEMTPTELRLIHELRRRPGGLDAVLQLLRIKAPEAPRALSPKKKARNPLMT